MNNTFIPARQKMTAMLIPQNRWILGPIAVWLLLYAWRPFGLGLYHDDWALFAYPHAIGVSQSFLQAMAESSNRYGEFLMFFAVNRLWNGSPAMLQLLAILLSAASAILLYRLCNKLASLYNHDGKVLAAVTTTLWLGFKWNIGATAFITSAMHLPALMLFLVSANQYADYSREGKWRSLALSAVLSALGYLVYESYYFAIFVIGLICAIRDVQAPGQWKRFALGMSIHSLALLPVVALAMAYSPKTFGVTKLVISNISNIPKLAFDGITPYFIGGGAKYVASLLLLFFLAALGLASRNHWPRQPATGKKDCLQIALLFAAISIGAMLGTVPFSLASYPLQGDNVFGRTTTGLLPWVSAWGGLLFACAWNMQGCRGGRAAVVSGTIIIILLVANSLFKLQDWAISWQLQKAIVAAFPIDKIPELVPDSVILIDTPQDHNQVVIFGAPWDISGAMLATYPELRKKFPSNPLTSFSCIYPHNPNPTWNGKAVTVLPNIVLPASMAYRWEVGNGKLYPLAKTTR